MAGYLPDIPLIQLEVSKMASGVATVWLPVKDMKRAVEFYRDTLGLELQKETDQWSELDANGLMVGLNAREDAGSDSDGGAILTFQPDGGIEDEVNRLKGQGVSFSGEISDHPWGRIAAFKDSEGNTLQVYAPPSD
ncbi:VOC family protein [Mycobacterium sp. 852013-51886_SCH5428379]|uniref:VOC family protein n=1 Tax=Mycobacterium sp. 852013-51886_SCH5428379 TaxID=1834111 RepID=UPI000AEA81C5|nr:VOC family protein [Mycobacterium sp. 852013-51886_SCH5428379]